MDTKTSSFELQGHYVGHVNSIDGPQMDNMYIELLFLFLYFNRSTHRAPIGNVNSLHSMNCVNKLYRKQIIIQHTPQVNRIKKPSHYPYTSPANQTFIKTTQPLHYYHTK